MELQGHRWCIQADRGSEASNEDWTDLQDDIFNDEFLLTRLLLEAISAEERVVLLIDEVDRVEVETSVTARNSFDYQVSIPELGTIEETDSNSFPNFEQHTRAIRSAKRRCRSYTLTIHNLNEKKKLFSPKWMA